MPLRRGPHQRCSTTMRIRSMTGDAPVSRAAGRGSSGTSAPTDTSGASAPGDQPTATASAEQPTASSAPQPTASSDPQPSEASGPVPPFSFAIRSFRAGHDARGGIPHGDRWSAGRDAVHRRGAFRSRRCAHRGARLRTRLTPSLHWIRQRSHRPPPPRRSAASRPHVATLEDGGQEFFYANGDLAWLLPGADTAQAEVIFAALP